MDIKPGMYFDTRTGEEVEVLNMNKDSGMISLYYHTNKSYDVVEYEVFKEKFIALDAISEAANVLFSDD